MAHVYVSRPGGVSKCPLTPVALFQVGKRSQVPRMDKVRPDQDIEIFLIVAGETMGSRWGLAVFPPAISPGPLSERWWCLDAGYDYGVSLLVWNDYDHHWSWEPIVDMRLVSNSKRRLRAVHPFFRPRYRRKT